MHKSTALYLGLLAVAPLLSSSVPIPSDNSVTITITNDLHNNSVITDTQNSGHMNIVNGSNEKADLRDSSNNNATSSAISSSNENPPVVWKQESAQLEEKKEKKQRNEDNKVRIERQNGVKGRERDQNRVTVNIENNVHDGSAITDSQNNGHINVINGGNNESNAEDSSSNDASSSSSQPLPSPANGNATSKQQKRNEDSEKEKKNKVQNAEETRGDRNSFTATVNNVKDKGTIIGTQNNGHVNIISGDNSNSGTSDKSTNTAGSTSEKPAPDSPVEPPTQSETTTAPQAESAPPPAENVDPTTKGGPAPEPNPTPAKVIRRLVACATALDNNVDITLDTGLKAGSNSTASMNNNEFEIYLEGRPEGLNITIHFAADKDSKFLDSGNGNKFRIFVGPAALESARNTTMLIV